jgi:hypothetical protein
MQVVELVVAISDVVVVTKRVGHTSVAIRIDSGTADTFVAT